MNPLILGLDISSVAIGFVLRNGVVLDRGVHRLQGADIGVRCQSAYDVLALLLDRYLQIDCLAIESPVARFAKAVIPQARVSGAVLTLAAQRWKPVIEVTPSEAKKALAGDGDASKEQMLMAAAPHFGYAADALAYVKVRGDWIALTSGMGIYSEHEADALGVALSASKKVEILHQEAKDA